MTSLAATKVLTTLLASTFLLASGTKAAIFLQQEREMTNRSSYVAQRRTPETRQKDTAITEHIPEPIEEPNKKQSVFPLFIERAGFLDLGTGKSIPIKINQEEGGDLNLSGINEEFKDLLISPESILEWRIGDNTQQTFDGGSAVASGGGFALGAIIGGGPIAPLLLLASPFLGMASGNKILPEWRIGVSRILENGREQNLLVQTYNQEDATKLGQSLTISTGLDAGVRRSRDEVSLIKSGLAQEMLDKLEEYKKPLLVVNNRKPWCSSIDLNTESAERSKYLQQKQLIVDLYNDLDMEYEPDEIGNSDIRWEEYLKSNPNMKKWAEANPEAAKSHKSCDI